MEDTSTPKEQNQTKPTKNDKVEKSLMIAENTESAGE